MDGGDNHRPPYGAASALIAWAAEHWDLIDATCLRAGLDPHDLPVHRLVNLAYSMIVESPGLQLNDDARREFVEAMGWPEDVEVAVESREDRSARASAVALGGADVDRMVAEAWAARQAALSGQGGGDR